MSERPTERVESTDPTEAGWDETLPPTSVPPTNVDPEDATTGAAARRDRFGLSLPTVIWGLLFGLAALAILIDQASDTQVDLGVAVPLVLLGAGAALVAWGIAGLARRRT